MSVGGGVFGFKGGGGAGGPKSITGPGVTTNPGALTQHGNWTVTFGTTSKGSLKLSPTPTHTTTLVLKRVSFPHNPFLLTSTGPITIHSGATGAFSLALTGRRNVNITSFTGPVDITAFGSVSIKGRLGTFIQVNTNPTTGVAFHKTGGRTTISSRTEIYLQTATTTSTNRIGFRTGKMGFFTNAPVARPSVASYTGLLSALTSLGLITKTGTTLPGGHPTGPASGDLSGTYPNPSVVKWRGHALSATTPALRQFYVWTPTGPLWIPTRIGALLTGHGQISLTTTTGRTQFTITHLHAAALVAGTNVTITTTGGKAKISSSGGGGGITTVHSTGGTVKVTTTTGPTVNLAVTKVPSSALVAGAFITLATTASKAKISVTGLPWLPYFYADVQYGAKIDGQQVFDGKMTTGATSHKLKCTTSAPFTAGDVGKTISVAGAGAGGLALLTTISAFTSAHEVTLTAACSTSVSAKTVVWGTNDTTAWRNAITAAVTAKGGIVTSSKVGMTLVNSALSGGAVLHIPQPSTYTVKTNVPVVAIIGPLMPSTAGTFVTERIARHGGLIFVANGTGAQKKTTGTATGDVINCKPLLGTGFANIAMVVRTITVRVPSSSSYNGVNCLHAQNMTLTNVYFDTITGKQYTTPEPLAKNTALICPATGNSARISIGLGMATGYYTGLQVGECLVVQDWFSFVCRVGVAVPSFQHGVYIERLFTSECTTDLVATGASAGNIIIQYFDIEYATTFPTWTHTVNNIKDPTNRLRGHCYINRVKAITGVQTTPPLVTGGAHFAYEVSGYPAWKTVTLTHTWQNASGLHTQFHKTASNLVEVQVNLTHGTAHTVMTLPVGFRPGQTIRLPLVVRVPTTNVVTMGMLLIQTTGAVLIYSSTGGVPAAARQCSAVVSFYAEN